MPRHMSCCVNVGLLYGFWHSFSLSWALNILDKPPFGKDFIQRHPRSVKGLSESIQSQRPTAEWWNKVSATVEDIDKTRLMTQGHLEQVLEADTFAGFIANMSRTIADLEAFWFDLLDIVPGMDDLETTFQESTSRGFILSTRASLYNIFYIDRPEIGIYYWYVKILFHHYMKTFKLDKSVPWWIHGWANCFRGGSNIGFHAHGPGVIAGNLAVRVPPGSHTQYEGLGEARAEDLFIPNRIGDLNLFDGVVQHRSSNVTEEDIVWLGEHGAKCRMTTAFDISLRPKHLWHSIPLYHPADPMWTRDPAARWADDLNEKIQAMRQKAKFQEIWTWDKLPSSKQFHERFTGTGNKGTTDIENAMYKKHMAKVGHALAKKPSPGPARGDINEQQEL